MHFFQGLKISIISIKVLKQLLGARWLTVVECLTKDQGIVGLSLTGGTVLCP